MDNMSNEYISSFSHFDQEFSPGNRLIDSFSEQFSFHHHPQDIKNYIKNLNDTVIETSSDPFSSIVI